jgi:hypothetical protein
VKKLFFLVSAIFVVFSLSSQLSALSSDSEPLIIKAKSLDILTPGFSVTNKYFEVRSADRVEISVKTEGRCRMVRDPWDDIYPPDQPGGSPREGWMCDEENGFFLLPETVYVKGKYIVYDDGVSVRKLAKRKGFFWFEWYKLRDNVRIEVNSPFASATVFINN